MKYFEFKKELVSGVALLSMLGVLFLPFRLFGAVADVVTDRREIGVGSDLIVMVRLDTEGVNTNAISGRLTFDEEIFELKEIRDNNSVVNFWVEKPVLVSQNSINFSGIAPLGFPAGTKEIFSVVFKSVSVGKGIITFKDLELLKNDGQGSSLPINQKSLSISVKAELAPIATAVTTVDIEPPLNFKPEIGQDPEIFEGKNFLVFVAEDKGSGILRYEVREGRFGKFIEAKSPYLIKNQSLRQTFYVKAIDKSLNERVVTLKLPLPWYKDYLQLVIIGLLILILGWILKIRWQRKYTSL